MSEHFMQGLSRRMRLRHSGFAVLIGGLVWAFILSIPVGLLQGEETRPNIVLVLADDLGWADLGCQGGDLVETPHLDQLAREGLRFTQAYAPAAICTPTRAALMTGKAPARLKMTVWSEDSLRRETGRKLLPGSSRHDLPLGEVTIAERLKGAGYLTASIGKWHLGNADHFPEAQGFDLNLGGNHWGAPGTFFFPYRKEGRFGPGVRYVPGLEFGQEGEYLTDRLTDEAIQVIDRAGDRPFFLYLAHYAVHTPLEAKSADVEYFQKKVTPSLRHQNATYAAMVKSLDESVGKLREHLRVKGLDGKTVFVFTSDNGGVTRNSPADGEMIPVTSNFPLRSGKGSLYEGGLRVPLLVSWPGVTDKGVVITQPVILTDLHRTLATIGGVTRTDEIPEDGVDLTPLLKDKSVGLREREFYFHYPHYYFNSTPSSAIRSGNWKLVRYEEDGSRELYHLGEDRGEVANRVENESAMADQLEGRLDAWLRKVGAERARVNDAFEVGVPTSR